MVSVVYLLYFAVFLMASSDGKKFRTPCPTVLQYPCDDGSCISKSSWCDNRYDCSDRSDENYCNAAVGRHLNTSYCKSDIHFQCDNGMCIPVESYCDGFVSCPDHSDEKNCPCEDLHGEAENFQYEAQLNQWRTHQKCWRLNISEDQYINLRIKGLFYNRDCRYGNITVYSAAKSENSEKYNIKEETTICASNASDNHVLRFYKNVFIRYVSIYQYTGTNNAHVDIFNITFEKVDVKCNDPDSFKCSNISCISPLKHCDGHKDCANGRDEENCDYGALSAAYLEISKTKSIQWMRSQHNEDWGWKGNTHRAVLALYLADDINFNGSRHEDDLIAKQLELELFTYLLRRKLDKSSSAELAIYINALLVLCHDPHNFYGYDLITDLKEDLKTETSFIPPFPLLTLCNAKEPISQSEVDRLLGILKLNSSNRGFILELQAHAALALSCVISNGYLNKTFEQNIIQSINNLKKLQMEDGSFSNEYTTALVLQALMANDQQNAKDWDIKSSLQFLNNIQDINGSFGNFLTTYLTMPVLNAKSLADAGKVNCSNRKWPRDGNAASDINSRLGKKNIMKYSLFIGDEKDQIHPLLLRTPENITVLELMTLAADIDPKYTFKTHEIKKKKYIYEIYNILNDPENNKFWFIYHGSGNETVPFSEQSPDEIKAHEKDHIIMWYKTLDSL